MIPSFQNVTDSSFPSILGSRRTKHELASALLTGRHVIIAGPPGIGKTTLAKNVSRLLSNLVLNDCEYHCDPKEPLCPVCRSGKTKTRTVSGEERFVRVQGSPDLVVEDLLGDIDPIKALQFGPSSKEAFTPGKIFRANQGVLFFDELNRAPEKLQNSLLQVLEEGKATLGAYSVDLPANFVFIGTMNPEENAGTEKLSDVFLDRFDVINMSYPDDVQTEVAIVVASGVKLAVDVPSDLLSAVVLFVRVLRNHPDVQKKPSVRASIGLFERSQANAVLAKRKTVLAIDVADAVLSVLSHRLGLKPSLKFLQKPEEFIKKEFEKFVEQHPELGASGESL